MPKKEGIKSLFDNIAPSYDKLNHILSLNVDKGWRRKAVKHIVDTDAPLKVLDVACGTGDFTIAIGKKLSDGSSVTGIDLSEGMLQIGRKKIAAALLPIQATLQQGDCEALPFKDGSFDRVSVAFGVRNFEHIGLGLSEMCRVLATGGKLVVLELSVPGNPVIRWCYNLYFLKILPWIGSKVSGNRGAYEYLPASVIQFPSPKRFAAMMTEAGFCRVEHKAFTFGICRMYIGYNK